MHKDNYDDTYDNSDGKLESNLLWWCQYCNIDLKGKKLLKKVVRVCVLSAQGSANENNKKQI